MRTPVRAKSAQPARFPSRVGATGTRGDLNPQERGILHLQQTAGNCAVQRQVSPEGQPNDSKAGDEAFWEWWKLVAGFEGSYEDWKARPENKHDRGGQTNWGVTKTTYMARAEALGLPATEEGFRAMTPDQAMRFGRMMWKSSGAAGVENPGVGVVLADWYWGGVNLGRFKDLMAAQGGEATFKEGMPDAKTIGFMNSLPPGALIEFMSDAKAAQYKAIAANDPTQEKFLEGWLKRNEERRIQARKLANTHTIRGHAGQALARAAAVLQSAPDYAPAAKNAAMLDLSAVIGRIETQQAEGFASEDDERAMLSLKQQLLSEMGRVMDAGS